MRDHGEISVFLDLGVAEEGWSPHTRDAYRRDLELYSAFLADLGKSGVQQSTASTILAFLAHRRLKGDGESTLNRRLAAIRSFHRHLLREGVLKEDTLSLLPSRRRAKRLPKSLSRAQVESLLEAPRGSAPLARRDRALLEILYATGIRVSEACGLDLGDLHPPKETADLPHLKVKGKGGKERFVPLHGKAAAALSGWLTEGRPRLVRGDSPPAVFLSRTGRRLRRDGVYRRVRDWGLKAGVSVRVTPHLLRHSFATHLVHEGAGLREVQEMLGHAKLETTTLYTSVDGGRLKALHERCHPRG